MMIKNMVRMSKGVSLAVSILCMQGCMGKKGDDLVEVDRSRYDVRAAMEQYPNAIPILVFGSGPAGLGAGLYGARDNTRTVVIEGSTPGGLLMYTTEVENWPGRKSIQGPEIIKELHEQVESVGAEFIQDVVEKVDFSVWPYEVHLMSGDVLHALTVVIATGASPRKLAVPGEEQYWGKGVTACAVCDARFFAGEDVVVVGGGDSAIEESLQLANHVRSVTILVRKSSMRAAASMQDRIQNNPSIKVVYNVEIKRILGDDKQVTGVELINHKTNEVYTMSTAGVFLAAGHIPNSKLFKGFVDVDDSGYIITLGRTQMTSLPGVFAAGEIEDHRYRQAGVSFGDGTKAGLDALAFLRHIGFSKVANRTQMPREAEGLEAVAADSHELPSITSYEELERLLQQEKRAVVLDFYTNTCPSCMQMMPLVKALAQEMRSTVNFASVDADVAIDVVKKFHVYKVPCLLVFKGGSLIARYGDAVASKQRLAELIEEFVA